MDFGEWLSNVPSASEIEPAIIDTENKIRSLQSQLAFLHGALTISKQKVPPPKREEPPCFGNVDVFDPESKRCSDCTVLDQCSSSVAVALQA